MLPTRSAADHQLRHPLKRFHSGAAKNQEITLRALRIKQLRERARKRFIICVSSTLNGGRSSDPRGAAFGANSIVSVGVGSVLMVVSRILAIDIANGSKLLRIGRGSFRKRRRD